MSVFAPASMTRRDRPSVSVRTGAMPQRSGIGMAERSIGGFTRRIVAVATRIVDRSCGTRGAKHARLCPAGPDLPPVSGSMITAQPVRARPGTGGFVACFLGC
jgi:hypothetical protein